MRVRHLALLSLIILQFNCSSAVAQSTVLPGPCADKRQQLQTYLEKAKAKGFGTAPYEAALAKIEENVKAGQAEAEILKQVNSLTASISSQVSQSKALKAAGAGGGMALGNAAEMKKLKRSKKQIPVSQLESHLFNLVNKHRRENGVATLGSDSLLARCARGHAEDMVKRNYFSHGNPEGQDGFQRAIKAGWTKGVRENIGKSVAGGNGIVQIEDIDVHLMNSPGHRANILDPSLKVLGVGVAYEPVSWALRVCQVFGK